MKISYKWLVEYVAVPADAAQVAEALTMSGTEIEGLEHFTVAPEVVVARIASVSPHPNADKLRLCEVDGGSATYKVVCGAPNARAGLLTAFAPVGTKLSDEFTVKQAKIRGEESFGILLSERELGLTDDHGGIMELDESLVPGTPLVEALDLEDWVLEVNVTPNRGDCLSVLGLARELSAIYRTEVRLPEAALVESSESSSLKVDIVDREACPRYSARELKNIELKPSPFWLRRRLCMSDVRPINNVVDVTNYLLLEFGQPMHAFDARFVRGSQIVVRKAQEGETFVTLDSVQRELKSSDLMICDAQGPVALAGVMGGENSEVKPDTANVILESAFFEPVTIRRTSKRLGLSTESSYRFERGIDPTQQARALRRAASLLQQLAGAEVLAGEIDLNHYSHEQAPVALRLKRMQSLLGLNDIKPVDVEAILKRLDCSVSAFDGEAWQVVPPAFRHDLTREVDLIEEFIRIYGMEAVKPELPAFRPTRKLQPAVDAMQLRLKLAAMGLNEAVNYAFIAPKWQGVFGAEMLELLNPISDELKYMRLSLLPGLLANVARNRNLQTRDIALFEIGHCFKANGTKLPHEQDHLAVALTGGRRAAHFDETAALVDFYDIKGLAEALLPGASFKDSDKSFLKAGHQAEVLVAGRAVGYIGALAAEVLKLEDVEEEVFVMEVELDALARPAFAGVKQLARYPQTSRDFSLVVDAGLTFAAIEQAIAGLKIAELRALNVIDIYKGDKLPAGKQGLTIRLTYQSDTQTLSDKQVSKWQSAILDKLANSCGAILRH